jgi:hypothetical protein
LSPEGFICGHFTENVGERGVSSIENRGTLLSHGTVEGRKIAPDVIEYALAAIDSYVVKVGYPSRNPLVVTSAVLGILMAS